MQVVVNGNATEVRTGAAVPELLEKLGLTGQRLAVLLDGEVVRKADFSQTPLNEGAVVEIIQMVGGG
jgi:sulfur carrier protein